MKKRRIQEIEPTAKLPGVKAHRKIASTMLSLKGGGLDADLDGLPSDWDLEEPEAKEAELVKATRDRLTGQMVRRTCAGNVSKAFKDNEIEYEWGAKLSPAESRLIQVDKASLAGDHFDQNKHQFNVLLPACHAYGKRKVAAASGCSTELAGDGAGAWGRPGIVSVFFLNHCHNLVQAGCL
jgi:hypothetical protein